MYACLHACTHVYMCWCWCSCSSTVHKHYLSSCCAFMLSRTLQLQFLIRAISSTQSCSNWPIAMSALKLTQTHCNNYVYGACKVYGQLFIRMLSHSSVFGSGDLDDVKTLYGPRATRVPQGSRMWIKNLFSKTQR